MEPTTRKIALKSDE